MKDKKKNKHETWVHKIFFSKRCDIRLFNLCFRSLELDALLFLSLSLVSLRSIMLWMLTEHKVLNEIMFTHSQSGAFWASIESQYTWNICLQQFFYIFSGINNTSTTTVTMENMISFSLHSSDISLSSCLRHVDPDKPNQTIERLLKTQIYILIEIQSTCCNLPALLFRFFPFPQQFKSP